MSSKYYITWDEFHNDVKALAQKLKNGQYNRIIAVSRGGLLPAGILAYELDIRNSQTINVLSYDNGKSRRDEDVEIDCNVETADEHTLIVDDLADSGRTFRLLRKRFPQAHFTSVYVKEEGEGVVDSCCRRLPNEWIVFPWDL